MIFLTLGSHEPFDRLVAAVDEWCCHQSDVNVYGQITDRGKYIPKYFRFDSYLDVSRYEETCKEADVIVAHAGMGSIITALTFAKPIVIMPRRAHLHEMRNDHQVATARRFRGKPLIFVADDETALAGQIEAARHSTPHLSREAFSPYAQEKLISFLRDAINR